MFFMLFYFWQLKAFGSYVMRMSSPSQKKNSNEMRARLSNEVIILPVHTEDEQFPCSHLQSTLVSECT